MKFSFSGGCPTNKRHTKDAYNVSSTVFQRKFGNMLINSGLTNYKIYICYLKGLGIITTQIVMYPLCDQNHTTYNKDNQREKKNSSPSWCPHSDIIGLP